VLHEFCHELLWENVGSPNFGFAHSAGDSLAAILLDPGSLAPDRFLTFPFISILNARRHDRDVTAGWAWGGYQPRYAVPERADPLHNVVSGIPVNRG
jgi:hypothetical protein